MSIGQMTARDCAEWCAYNSGWVRETGVEGDPVWCKREDLKRWNPSKECAPEGSQDECPFQITIESALTALPRGWEVQKKDSVWMGEHANNKHTPKIFIVTYPDDMTAIYRIAVAARCGGRDANIGSPRIPTRTIGKTRELYMSLPLTAYLRGEVHVCNYCGCTVINKKCEGCGASDVVQVNIDQPPKNLPTYTSGELLALGVAKGLCLIAAFALGMAVWEWLK